jgi:3-oxoacyl-[acyl-carrier protein] reductase
MRADVTSEKQAAALMRKALKEFGRLDILINNADDGRFEFKGPLEISPRDWELMLRGSLLSVLYCCKHALPIMREGKYGRIVNISAAGSDKDEIAPLCLPYYIAKQGVVSLTRALAAQEAKNDITVNSVAPAFVENYGYPLEIRRKLLRRIPAGRFAKTEEVARAVSFLIRDETQYVTGVNLVVGGGYG